MTITGIVDHGTVVAVHTDEGRIVVFDHRPFWELYNSEAGDVVGREVELDEVEGVEILRFVD